MGYRTYEADKEGRITVYPSLNSYGIKRPGILKTFIKRLIDMATGNGKVNS